MERIDKIVKVKMFMLTPWSHARENKSILPLLCTRLEGGVLSFTPVALTPEKEPSITIKEGWVPSGAGMDVLYKKYYVAPTGSQTMVPYTSNP